MDKKLKGLLFCFIISILSADIVFSQNYYDSEKIIVVGGDHEFPPFEYINDDYIPQGFSVDVIRAVAKTMQLDIELVLEPWYQVMKKLDAGEIDMLEGMFYSEDRAEKYLFSSPIIVMNQAVFKRKNSPPYQSVKNLTGKEIIVQNGDVMHEYAVNNKLTDKLIVVESPVDGLRLLASGKHDFLLTSRIVGLYWINELDLNNLTTGDNLVSKKYCFVVPKDNHDLMNKLNEGLIIIQQTGVYNDIYEKWFSKLDPDLYLHKKTFRIIQIVIISLVTMLLAFALWLWSLRKTVKRRTADLEKEIKEHHIAEIELLESRELYDTLFSDFTEAFLLVDSDSGEFIKYNKKACELCVLTPEDFNTIKLKDFVNIIKLEYLEEHINKVIQNGFDTFDTDFINKNGEKKSLIIKSKKMEISRRKLIQSIAIDITEKKYFQEKLIQAGKLEAVGTLAGGIAHDFNNILAVIIGYSEIGTIALNKDDPGWEEFEEILKAGNRAKEIVKQILLFSRNDNLEKETVNPGAVLDESWNFLRSTLPTTIQIIKNKSANLLNIFANTTQIYQILLNLCTNSSHAMEDTGGIITISMANTVRNNKNFVKISVSDTGKGLDPETIERIFDPYFTTKVVGKGSGLGLAVVHGIVKDGEGFIEIDNEPGKGVTFHVFFPAVETVLAVKENKKDDLSGGKETILVVDDEEIVADVISKYLDMGGYNVITATEGKTALEIYRRKHKEIDLVITDQTMPDLTGLELTSKIMEIEKCPVIIVTGFSTKINEENIGDFDIEELLIKPINRNKMLEVVRNVLDRKTK